MDGWWLTAVFAQRAVAARRHRQLPRFTDAIVRGCLLLDLASAGAVVPSDAGMRRVSATLTFSPAEAMLIALESDGVTRALRHGPVRTTHVLDAFVDRGWWERVGGSWPRSRSVRPVGGLVSTGPTAELADVLMALYDAQADVDDIELAASDLDLGAGTWLMPWVVHQLVEIRLWGEAVAHTNGGGGGGGG